MTQSKPSSVLETDTAQPVASTADSEHAPAEPGLWSVFVAAAIALAGFLWYRLDELVSGFHTDESLSVWVSKDGLGDAISRAHNFQGQSPVYFTFLWLWRQVVGDSELLLRLPSLLAVLAACLIAVQFGRELGSTHMGFAAALVLLSAPGVLFYASSVRPYGFLLLFAMMSSRALWHWLNDPDDTRNGVIWAVTLALAVTMTPFAATLGLAHLVALADNRRSGQPFPKRLGLCIGIAAAMTLPLAPQVLRFFINRESFVITDQPHPLLVLSVLVPAAGAVIVLLSAPGRALDGITSQRGDTPALFRFFLAWSALPILTLYLVGLAAGSPVFLERYRIVAVLGGALLIGLVVRNLPSSSKHIAVIALALFAVWTMGGNLSNCNGWENAFTWAETQTETSEDRILALNPKLVETADLSILDDPEWTSYLGAHAAVYDFDGPTLILSGTDPSVDFLAQRAAELFTHDHVVVIDVYELEMVTDPNEPGVWTEALTAAANEAGYSTAVGPRENCVAAAVFSRS